MASCQYHLWVMVVLCLLCRPSEGLLLCLLNKPVEQSSTYRGSGSNANLAIDGNRDTSSHTRCGGDQWWRVDLQATHVLTKITIVNRNDCCGYRLAGAVVRAGYNIDHTQNTAIGSPVTSSQATNGAVIDFIPASTISARYVSVELTGQCLNMAEVIIEEDTDASLLLCLLNKPVEQSSTYRGNGSNANLAIDGNRDTRSHTKCNGDQWWRVDLQATYLLAKITIVNRKDCCGYRLQGAIVRAGLSSDHSENRMIGSSVTSSQATNGAVIDFIAVPTVSARYVSVELSGECLQLAEVMIGEAVDAVSLIVTDVDSESVTLSWFMRACPDYYRINYALSNRDGCENITQLMYNQHCMCLGTSSVTTISGLLPNSMYSVQIKAYVNGVYGPTTSVNFTTSTSKPTHQTAQVAVQNRTPWSLSFSWSPPPCGGRRGIITGYAYLLSKLGSEPITVVNSTTPSHGEVTIDELIPFTSYSFQVAAQTVRGIGPYSEVVTTRTLEAAPTVPLDVSIREVDDISLLFVWSEPDPPQGIITHYNVRYWRSGENGITKTIYSITQLMHRVVGLESSTTYFIQVQAVTSVGEGPWSIAINATTKIGGTVSGPTPERGTSIYTTHDIVDPPAPPQPIKFQDEFTDTTVTIGLTSLISGDEFVKSLVVRVTKTASSVTKRDVLVPSRYEDSSDDYIAAEFPKEFVPDKFVVGDAKMYGGYYNAPLQTGAIYNIRVGFVSKGNEMEATVTYSEPLAVTVQKVKGSNINGAIIAAAVLGVTVLILVLIVIAVCVMRRRRIHQSTESPLANTMEMVPSAMSKPTVSGITSPRADYIDIYEDIGLPSWATKLEIKWQNLVIEDAILGKGNFGEVRAGSVKDNGKVTKAAIKTCKESASDAAAVDDFKSELQTMASIKPHPNIVRLLGACIHEAVLYVALEYLPNGNLRDYLRSTRPKQAAAAGAGQSTLTSSNLLTFGVDVARGMDHLSNTGIIHRDLAARNVLLAEDLTAKVSDFGLSRGEDIYVQKSSTRIPARWLAVESLTRRVYKSKSDVWSFGILLWEIATYGATPYPGIDSKTLAQRLLDGYRMPKPENCADEIYDMMLNCWQEKPSKRPSFRELFEALKEMNMSDENIYLSPTVYENFVIIHELDDN